VNGKAAAITAALLGLLFLVTRIIPPLFTWRGRRLLLGRWRRLRHWEFWPYYVVNIATFIYVVAVGLFRYRRLTLFTVTNPAIKPDSGFIGESKADIFTGLPQDALGRWEFVPNAAAAGFKRERLARFMAEHELDFPLVFKPDRGQRGLGVRICRDAEQARAWIEAADFDYIMMEYLPGEEFGLFYYRLPDEEHGRIFSINRKKLLSVTGDGRQTLAELILADDRAVCMAPMFFKNHPEKLFEIVPKGETRQLGEVGTHSLGAVFLDGRDLDSPELLAAVENIAGPYEGFYFGRFDFKAANEHEFTRGRNLKVVELNGLTSEATHIYDPKNSLWYAWRVLIEQWSLAFKIAEQNAARGHEPLPLKEFMRHWYRAGTGGLDVSSQPS